MPAKLQHSVDLILAKIMIARSLGSDPTGWETYVSASANKSAGTRPTGAWPIFVAAEPAEPVNVITVYQTTPQIDARLALETQQHYGFSVRVRGKDREACMQKARDIEDDFNRLFIDQQITISGQQYLVPSIPGVSLVPIGRMLELPHAWLANLNCLCNVLAYPITG